MTKSCPNCFSANLDTNKFCSNCGSTLSSASATPEATSPGAETPAGDINISSPWAPPSTAYVVKTSADAEGAASDPQAPTMPMSTFVPPPAPSSMPVQYFASEGAQGPAGPAGPSVGYQGYVPGASSRNEGAAYMPYSAGTAAPLEKSKNSRSFLMPIIVGAAVVLLGLAGFSGWLVANSKSETPAAPLSSGGAKPPTPVPTVGAQATRVPANAPEEDKVKEVIRVSNDEQITA